MSKICTICNKEHPETMFYTRGDKTGLRSECKACSRKQRICPLCGAEHNSFYTKGKSDVCPTCYPLHRQAYQLWHAALYRSKRGNLGFDIDVLDIYKQLKQPCPKTGHQFVLNEKGQNIGNRNPYSPSLDKIDPTKGYTKDNCRVVCWWYNVTKQRYSDEEVLNLCKQIVSSSEMKPVQNVDEMDKTNEETI